MELRVIDNSKSPKQDDFRRDSQERTIVAENYGDPDIKPLKQIETVNF